MFKYVKLFRLILIYYILSRKFTRFKKIVNEQLTTYEVK